MEDQDIKTLKLEMDYFDEDGKKSVKLMSININKPKDISPKGFHGYTKKSYSMSFSMKIPEHIHSYLLGKSVARYKMGKNHEKTYSDFPKTINKPILESLCEEYFEITQDYLFLKQLDQAKLKKVIFFGINSSKNEYRSTQNSIHFGIENQIKYNYSIGYISNNDHKSLRYNSEKLLISENQHRDFYLHKFVEWSEEREEYFKGIQSSFEQIIDRFNKFNVGLNDDTINEIISKNTKLLQ